MAETLLIPREIATRQGSIIAERLRALGEHPCGAALADNGRTLAIGFEIIATEPKWRKTVEVPTAACSANEVHDQLNAWREKMRGRTGYRNRPSAPVRLAIEVFGLEAVTKALEHRSR